MSVIHLVSAFQSGLLAHPESLNAVQLYDIAEEIASQPALAPFISPFKELTGKGAHTVEVYENVLRMGLIQSWTSRNPRALQEFFDWAVSEERTAASRASILTASFGAMETLPVLRFYCGSVPENIRASLENEIVSHGLTESLRMNFPSYMKFWGNWGIENPFFDVRPLLQDLLDYAKANDGLYDRVEEVLEELLARPQVSRPCESPNSVSIPPAAEPR